VYDPSFFDDDSKEIPGMHSDCNPMREVNANSLDTFEISFNHVSQGAGDSISTGFGSYEYSGLRCPDYSPSRLKLSVTAFKQQLASYERYSCGINCVYGQTMNNNISLFGNFMALAYDSQKGIPSDIDFDDFTSSFSNGAISSSQIDHILASTVLARLEEDKTTVPRPSAPPFMRQVLLPVNLQASLSIRTRYTNAALDKSNTTTTPSAVFVPLSTNPYRIPTNVIVMSFSTTVTVVSREVINLSILTTISIIVSTAGAVWNAQQKIKDGILMVAACCGKARPTKLTENIRN